MHTHQTYDIAVPNLLKHGLDEFHGSRKLRVQNPICAISRIRNSEKLSFVELGGQSLGRAPPVVRA